MPCPVPLDAARGMANPQEPEPPQPRPEEVMPDDHINSAHRTYRHRRLRRLPEHGIACLARGRLHSPRIPARGNRGGTADQQRPHRNRAVAGRWEMHPAPFTRYVGDARAVLAGMPEGSANCIVTSPPYWGKRDYGVAG